MLRLYTDESPGLKVDPMVIMFLSLGFIFSVVALHCEFKDNTLPQHEGGLVLRMMLIQCSSDCEGYEEVLIGSTALANWRSGI